MTDWAAEGLLDGLEGAHRSERLELLEWMEEQGMPLERIRESHERGLLAFLPAGRIVGGDERFSAEEICERTGIELGTLTRLRRASGLAVAPPAEAAYTLNDLETAERMAELLRFGMELAQMESIARVLGRGLGQAAEVMRAVVLEISLEPGLTEKQLAERYAAVVELVMPRTGPLLDGMMRLHLEQMVAEESVDATERTAGRLPGARDMAVCFADLVGFTRMGEEVQPDELGAVADRLAELASALVEPPVRFVKTIGDAVMAVSPVPEALAAFALDLIDRVDQESDALPQVHAGIAYGPVLNRGGDWFGAPVNMAARVTAIARAGSLLATADASDRMRDDFDWSFAGERPIKGVRAPVKLFRGRRPKS